MLKIRKFMALATMLALATTAFSACGQSASAGTEADEKKMKVVCTIFPGYDWVKEIMGEKAKDADIRYLLGNGIDLHNYRPSADDLIAVSECDLFVYVGGESDEWVDNALENAVNKDMKTVCLVDAVGEELREEEVREGMQAEEEEEDESGEEPEYDEHVWLSVRNAKLICSDIADKLCELDAVNSDTFRTNLSAYTAELDALDRDFETLISSAPVKTLLFGDRFPFRYFTDDYGLDYYAAFAGCSAETEASFETIVFLAKKVDELNLKTVYTLENSDRSIAETVINNTFAKDATIVGLDSLQSTTKEQADGGVTYISLMRKNYDVLKDNLK